MVPVMFLLPILLLWPASAEAAPVLAPAIASALGVGAPLAGVIASVAVTLVGSLASFALSALLRPGAPRAPELVRDLSRPQSLPPYRSVYGYSRVSGSPAPMIVRGRTLVMCLILNSRPSAGFEELLFDKRPVEWSGDPLNWETGATITSAPFTTGSSWFGAGANKFWVGLGGQVSPPAELLALAPGELLATDGWQGRTVIWLRLDAGPNERRAEIWPRTPPEIECVIRGCKLWNPTDPAQDPDNPATWTWSTNRTLCLLDALRTNPVRPYPLAMIHLPSFIAAILSDGAAVAKIGGIEPRYQANGVLIWTDRELEDQLSPLVDAGASRLVRIGGQLGLTTGTWIAPAATIDDLLDEGLSFERWKPGRDLATTIAATYLAPDRDWQMAAVPPYQVPGAQAADGGPEVVRDLPLELVTSPTQAQRLAKIAALRNRAQRRVTGVVPPRYLDLVAGANVTLALPAPYAAMNGDYEVVSLRPRLIPEGDDAVAASAEIELLETGAGVFAWDPETEERPVEPGLPVTPGVAPLAAPTGLTLLAGESFATGEDILPAVRVQVDAPGDERAIRLEAEWRVGSAQWLPVTPLDYDRETAPPTASVFIVPVQPGVNYEARARWVGVQGLSSDWVSTTVEASAPAVTLDPPTDGEAVAQGSTAIRVEFKLPNGADVRGIRFYRALTDATGSATLFAGPIYAGPNSTMQVTASGLSEGTQYWFWARTVGPFGNLSGFSDSVSDATASGGGA